MILLYWREYITKTMPSPFVSMEGMYLFCDLPCSELSKGTSGWIEGSERAAPRRAGKFTLQHWEAVAAGARRANAAWHWLCSYAGCWWNVRGLKRGKGIPGALSKLISWLMWEDACPMAETTAELWACTVGNLAQLPVCSWPLVYAGEAMVWLGEMDQHEAGWVSELLAPFRTT